LSQKIVTPSASLRSASDVHTNRLAPSAWSRGYEWIRLDTFSTRYGSGVQCIERRRDKFRHEPEKASNRNNRDRNSAVFVDQRIDDLSELFVGDVVDIQLVVSRHRRDVRRYGGRKAERLRHLRDGGCAAEQRKAEGEDGFFICLFSDSRGRGRRRRSMHWDQLGVIDGCQESGRKVAGAIRT
jgi:hypothetical protein